MPSGEGGGTPDARKAVPLEVVVVAQLCARRDCLPRKDAHARLALHHPVLRLAVGATGVVQVPRQAPLGRRVQQQAPAGEAPVARSLRLSNG